MAGALMLTSWLPACLLCRFEREEGEERLPCACGAPTCSGFLN